jgi:sigma-B regulation protein RsbU (phosphoserine phosphatase)
MHDLDRVPCGYLVCGVDGSIVDVNTWFETISGHRRADLVGKRRFVELLSAGGRIYYATHFAPSLQMHGEVQEIALELVRADGDRLPILVNAAMDAGSSDGPGELRIAVFAATERRSYEHELLDAKQRAEASEQRAVSLAQTLQQTLIPPIPPEVPGLEVSAEFRPAGRGDQLSGDFYDVFEVRDSDWFVVVGDVCGKGPEAAVVTAASRHAIRALAVRESRPSRVLAELNALLLQPNYTRYCTAVVMRLHRERSSWTATVACGGHEPPVITGDGGQRRLGELGPLLGVFPTVTYVDRSTRLAEGDTLVVYTDGVNEARRDGELYGQDRVLDWLRAHRGTPTAVSSGLLDEVVSFQHGNTADDIVVIALATS